MEQKPKLSKFQAAAAISEILDQLSQKDAIEVLKMVSAVYDRHLVSNFAPVTTVPQGPASRGGRTSSGRGRGRASSAPQGPSDQKKELNAKMKVVKDNIRAEVSKSGKNLSSDHPLILERNQLLKELTEIRTGSNRQRDDIDSEGSKSPKRQSPKEKKASSSESKTGSITSPSLPKGGEEEKS